MSRALNAPAAGDLRQGVTPAEHAVLDRLEELFRFPAHSEWFLAEAQKAAAAALRANPDNGMGGRRVERAREAAALLILALHRMDDNGRELQK